ncbi:EpsG family protein [uncultured Alistipes sp.]|uniref:EpsG family protein n=1 Tax=uncultured Alistipes sp. TaxID=538949 RepID=UPI002635C271|nr:EpsG family protein [uncultured Alistipes sp.]
MWMIKTKNNLIGSLRYEKDRKQYVIFCGILLILQSGLRNIAVGADTYGYKYKFETDMLRSWSEVFHNIITVYVDNEGKDAGFTIFNKLVSVFISNYQIYLILIAILFFIPFMRFLYLNTKRIEDIMLAMLLYQALFYEFFSITGIRQTLAAACCFSAYEFVKQRRIVPFLTWVLVGTLLHKSCLLFLPFYWIGNYRHVKILFIGSLILFPVITALGSRFTQQLVLLSGSDNYLIYINESSRGAFNFLFFLFATIFIGFYAYKLSIQNDPNRRFVFNACSLAIFFSPLTINSANLLRVVLYYDVFLLLLIGFTLEEHKDNTVLRIAKYLFICAMFFKIVKSNYDYAFYWQYMALPEHYL